MNILIPILGFAPQGGYRVLSELANEWIRMGHTCDFLVPSTSSEPYFPTEANIIRYSRKGVSTSRDFQRKISGIDNMLSLFYGLSEVGSKYDIILANHSFTAWPLRLANCGNATKFYYIQAYEPDYYPKSKYPFQHFLSLLSYRLNLKKIVNSTTYSNINIKPLAMIPPGIELNIFKFKNDSIDLEEKENIVMGTVGRLEPYKGTETALAAYRKLRLQNPRVTMRVAFGNVQPSDDIEIVKINNDTELAEFYRSLDLLIVSCYSQHGAPHYPLIEAMASGTPVVHTDYYPGSYQNSWVSKTPSKNDVFEAMCDFINASNNEINRKRIMAREFIESELAWHMIAKKFITIFESERKFK